MSRIFLVLGILFLGLTLGMTCKKRNQPPGAPSIPSGPVSGRKGDTLRFSTVAEDPDGDSVAVRFDWGDSTVSDWSGFVRNGDSVVMTHVWQRLSTYSIRAQARDARETASAWSGEQQLTIGSFSVTLGGLGDDAGSSVQQTADGGYIVTGRTDSYGAGDFDVYLVKTDASGNMVWDKTFGGAGDDEGNSVQQTSDGGYIVAGCTDSYGAGGHDVWLIKTNSYGNKVWDKTFGGPNDDEGNSVQQTSDGGYIISGYTYSYGAGNADVWLIKTDASGSRVWDKTFGGADYDFGNSVVQTSDGYAIIGYTDSDSSGNYDVWLIKTDTSGDKVWDKTFRGRHDDRGASLQQTADGGYIITGYTWPDGPGGFDVWLIRTDASGNEVWDRTFGGTNDDRGYSVRQTSDGGYIIAGTTESFGIGQVAIWLIKTDTSGSEVWDTTFGRRVSTRGTSLQQTFDGGYVITGSTHSSNTSDCDLWLIKTDADGN